MIQDFQIISSKEYLNRKGTKCRKNGNELITHCLFNDCDQDSQGNEAQIYDWEALNHDDKLMICEDELDRLALFS